MINFVRGVTTFYRYPKNSTARLIPNPLILPEKQGRNRQSFILYYTTVMRFQRYRDPVYDA
jgi:hypothetical protein